MKNKNQEKDNASALNKALIFVGAFVVSSLLIYQFYYYNKIHTLSSGIVATADELPKTRISPFMIKHFSDTNYMGNAGLLAANGDSSVSNFSMAPKENYLSGKGVYGKAFLDELNIGISAKFPNHPPIGFGNLKDGDKILFSYLFKNILLPVAFSQYKDGIEIEGKHFRAIRYMQTGKDSSTKAYFYGENLDLLFINLSNAQTLIITKNALPAGSTDSLQMKKSTLQDWKNKSVILPEIDFNIIKYWKKNEAYFLPDAAEYDHLEERLKIKLTATEQDSNQNQKPLELKPPYFIYLYNIGEQKPYFSLYISNTEILLPLKR